MNDLRVCLKAVGWAVVVFGAVELLTVWRYRGPAPKPVDVPVTEFSAERAVEIHTELFPPKPHPTGSFPNQLVRDRLIELLKVRGWRVEVQPTHVEGDYIKTQMFNVVAEWPRVANPNARPLVLASHYDSCQSGPGAADAGACVAAIIEAANVVMDRISATDSTNPDGEVARPLFLVFSDGEELGTLGAEQIARRHSLSARKPVVFNLDARGTRGPVLMYETHPGNRTHVTAWINRLAQPRISGSLFTVVYRAMPNGSDFTPYRKAGWEGFNFAIIGGADQYHTPDDTLANLDRRSLQHYGEHIVNLAEPILRSADELETIKAMSPRDDAAYFDVLGWFVVYWPLNWCLPLSLAGFVLMFAANFRRMRTRSGLRTMMLANVCLLLVIVAAGGGGWFLGKLWRDMGLLPREFVPHGPLLCIILWLYAVTISLGFGRWVLGRSDWESIWGTVWVNWSIVGIYISLAAPEFCHLAFVPEIAGLLMSCGGIPRSVRLAVTLLSAALTYMPTQHLLLIALGPSGGLFACTAIALSPIPLYPALTRLRDESSDISPTGGK